MTIEQEIFQERFENDELKLYINLLFTASWLRERQNRFFTAFQVSPQQYNILRILKGQSPKAGNSSLLKERMIDKDVNLGRLIDKLESTGLAEKRVSEADRRQIDILITEKGLRLVDDINVYLKSEYGIISRLSAKDMHTLNNLLDKLRG
jgi:MarR family multiple gene transcriptional regulator MgrA